MDELVPVILGGVLGVVIWLTTGGKIRFLSSLFAVLVSGTIVTVASGEYHESWIYLLLDFGEAALGLAVGYVVAGWLLMRRRTSHAPSGGHTS
jgi:hypothetical protein